MKIALVNLYPAETAARYLLSSYVLKAYLQEFHDGGNLQVSVLNFGAKTDPQRICRWVLERRADLVGFSCYIWNIEKILDVLRRLRDGPGPIRVLGGPEISTQRIRSLPDPAAADYYVIGEGERKLLRLVRYLEAGHNGQPVELPEGIARWRDGRLHYAEDTTLIQRLDEVPSVYLSGAIEDRLYARQQAFLETQRGCRFRCGYCLYGKLRRSISYYPLPRVLEELDYLVLHKKVAALRIFDAVFTSDLDRAKAIVRHLVELKGQVERLPWIYWESTYDRMDEQFMRLVGELKYGEAIENSARLRPAGRPQHYREMLEDYTAVNCVGVQSFCPAALKSVNRPPVDPRRFGDFLERARRHNIALKIDVILGLPFETFDSYFRGLELLLPHLEHTDHVLNVHRLQVLSGSKLQQRCREYGIAYSTEAPHTVTRTNAMTPDDLGRASRLTAVLFRVLNSPLRGPFYQARRRCGGPLRALLEGLLTKITDGRGFDNCRLAAAESVDDEYWNDEVFGELPAGRMAELLQSRQFQLHDLGSV